MADVFELELTAMANGGRAFGRLGDKAIFVPYAVPGEVITARIVEDRGSFAHAEGVQVLEPSPDRVTPECPHFGPGRCGGCHWQHIDYSAQLRYKRDVVIDQLQRVGKIKNARVHETIPSQDEWGYLSHATFRLTEAGEYAYVSTDPSRLLPIDECHTVRPEILDLLNAIDLDDSTIHRLAVQIGSDGRPLVIISTSDDLAPELHTDVPLSVNLLLSDNEPVNLIGSSNTVYTVDDWRFRVTAGGFFRPNVPMIGVLAQEVLRRLALRGDEAVLDLYAGVGVFSAFIAPEAALVTLVESYPPAVTDADLNLADYDHVDLFEGGVAPVLRSLQEEDAAYDAAVVDPPPRGLEPDVVDLLAEFAPPTLVYVSSDPTTLARDAARLIERGFRLRDVQPVDLAPQTYFVECVAHFTRG